MANELKNILLAGLGTAAYTYEKAANILEDMVAKGKLTVDEGKDLAEELKRNVTEKSEKIRPITKEDMVELLKEMNFATKDDLSDIKARLAKLEEKNL